MSERAIVGSIVFLLIAGVILLVASLEEPSRVLDWIGGALAMWGTLVVQFYFRKKGPPANGR